MFSQLHGNHVLMWRQLIRLFVCVCVCEREREREILIHIIYTCMLCECVFLPICPDVPAQVFQYSHCLTLDT